MKLLNRLIGILKNQTFKAGAWYTFSNILNKAVGFISMPLFTKFMTPDEFGVINTYLSWVTVISIFIGLFLYQSVVVAFKDFTNDINKYLSSVLTLSFISFIFIGSLIYGSVIFFNIDVPHYIVLFAIVESYAEFIIAFYLQKLIMKNQYKLYAFISSTFSIFIVILSLVLMFTFFKNNKPMARIFSAFLVETIVGIILGTVILLRGKKFINLKYWKYSLRYSVPLIIHGSAAYILSQSDRLMLSAILKGNDGLFQTGIYSVVYNFGMLAQVVSTAIINVWVPFFTNSLMKNKINLIDKKAKIFTEVFSFITIGLLLSGPEVMRFMVRNKDYWSGTNMLVPITASAFAMFLYSFFTTTEGYYKKTFIMSINTVIAAFINVVLNLLFIPKYGAIAAAYSTLVAYIVSAVIHYFMSRRCNKEFLSIKNFLKPILIVSFVSILTIIANDCWQIRWLVLLIIIVFYVKYILKNFNIIAKE